MTDVGSTLSKVLTGVAVIATLIGGTVIMSLMLIAVSERRKEIGVRRAVGASRRDIMVQFLVEAAVISFIGGLVGIVIGVGGTCVATALAQAAAGDHVERGRRRCGAVGRRRARLRPAAGVAGGERRSDPGACGREPDAVRRIVWSTWRHLMRGCDAPDLALPAAIGAGDLLRGARRRRRHHLRQLRLRRPRAGAGEDPAARHASHRHQRRAEPGVRAAAPGPARSSRRCRSRTTWRCAGRSTASDASSAVVTAALAAQGGLQLQGFAGARRRAGLLRDQVLGPGRKASSSTPTTCAALRASR